MSKLVSTWVGRMSLLAATSMLLGACAGVPHKVRTEELSESWNGESFSNLLIIGAYDDRTYRVSAETAFAEDLKQRGVAAKPSYDLIADLKALDEEDEIAEALAGQEVDAVLSVTTIDPGYDFGYEDAMASRGMVYLLGGRPGRGTDLGNFIAWAGSGYYTLHVALWDAETQRPVWQVTTSSETTGSESGDIRALVEFTVERLRENGLL